MVKRIKLKNKCESGKIKPHQLLIEAIILQAVRDYRVALKKDDRCMKRDCERFFRSEWFQRLSKLDGNKILNRLRAEVKSV